MTRYKVISVDDEPNAHAALRALLRDTPDIDFVTSCTSPAMALSILARERHHLLFLDVAMPEMNGLDFLRALANPPVTVLLTARVEHALVAFELGVRDYLLKPVSGPRLERCLDHIRPLLHAALVDTGARAPARLAIKCGTTHRLIDPARTVRIEAAGNFCTVHTDDREVFASESMKDLERRLAPFGFVRVHKSHMVNVRFVRSMSGTGVALDTGLALPIGRAYREAAAHELGIGGSIEI